ncbi:spore coat protein YsxE, partial [Brevibacillus sp. SIMBA_076]
MHTLSVKEIQVDIEEREAHYERTLDAWNNEKDFMDEYIVSCEKKWYMSPFELQYCTYYHHVMRAREFATKQLSEWHDAMKEKEKTRT